MLSSCGDLNISKEKRVIQDLKNNLFRLESIWKDFANDDVLLDLDTMLLLVEAMPDTSELNQLEGVKREQAFFWKDLAVEYQGYKTTFFEIGKQIQTTQENLERLKEDRINRAVQRERFFLYVQSEQRVIKTIRQNLKTTIQALNNCHDSFKKYGTILAKLSEEPKS